MNSDQLDSGFPLADSWTPKPWVAFEGPRPSPPPSPKQHPDNKAKKSRKGRRQLSSGIASRSVSPRSNKHEWPGNTTRSRSSQIRLTLRRKPVQLALIGFVAAVAVGFAFRSRGPSYPKQWDPTVAKLADTTANLRGLRFKHPVYVRFLTDAEFEKNDVADRAGAETFWAKSYVPDSEAVFHCFRNTIGESHPPCAWTDGNSGDDVDPTASVFRAIGLAGPKDDVSALPLNIEGAFAIARYDDIHKVIEVRGKSTKGKEPTIVHELTHVLHDQNFRMKWPNDSDEVLAFRALLEGDARRIENDFVDTEELSSAEREARKKAENETDQQAEKRISSAVRKSGLKEAIVGLRVRRSSFPYDEGEYFVRTLERKFGQKGIDAAFAHPPQSSAEILNPSTYLEGGLKNPVPPDLLVSQDAYSTKPLRLGAWYAAEALWAAGLDDDQILDVIRAWNGDGLVIYEDQSKQRVCFKTAIRLRGPQSTKASDTLSALAKHLNGTFKRTGRGATFEACDLSRKIVGSGDDRDFGLQDPGCDGLGDGLQVMDTAARRLGLCPPASS